ncbi:MAG: iron-sulfur cluster assembly scaffold protein [bacterium]|nr:iron-sulfur cluster assembly scaffold protein [bacterium]
MSVNIYKEIILEHWKNPHNYGRIPRPARPSLKLVQGRVLNPSCGDEIEMTVLLSGSRINKFDSGEIKEIKFQGRGCVISRASASLLTDYIKGKDLKKIANLKKEFIIKLLGVPISISRLKCALLPLEALKQIINDKKS